MVARANKVRRGEMVKSETIFRIIFASFVLLNPLSNIQLLIVLQTILYIKYARYRERAYVTCNAQENRVIRMKFS